MAVFAHCASSSGDGQVNCRRLHDICMTSSWLWVNLSCYPCKHESEILSRRIKCPPCLCRSPSKSKRYQSVAAFLTNFGGMALRRRQLSPIEYQWSSRKPQSVSYLPGLLQCSPVIWSIEVLKDWHLIQCSQTDSGANSTIPKLTLQWTPQKKMQRSWRGKPSIHVLPHDPENPEADPHGRRGEPGTWSAIGLKQFSYLPDGDELRMLPAGQSTGQHLWVIQKMPIRGTTEGNRMGRTPWTELLKPIMNYGMTIGPSYSTLVLAKWSIAKCSTGSWPWVNLSYFQCKDESDLFWRCLEYRAHACHVTESQRWTSVTAVSTDFGMVPNRLTTFFNASCGAIRCKNGLPQSYLSCFQNLYPTFSVKAESNMA